MAQRVVVTVSIGEGFDTLAAITHPPMARYAEACDADFVVWRDLPPRYMHEHFRRFAIPDELHAYERVLYLDSDIFVRPGAANLFERVPADRVGMCDEASFGAPDWAANRMRRALEWNNRVLVEHGVAPFEGAWNGHYYNGGVTLTSREHRALHTLPLYDPRNVSWDGGAVVDGRAENQPYLNFLLHYHALPVQDVGFRFNCTNPFMRTNNRTIAHVKRCHFFHATGRLSTKLRTLHKLLPLLTTSPLSDG